MRSAMRPRQMKAAQGAGHLESTTTLTRNGFEIDESSYGTWAAEFRRLLRIADQVPFFRKGGATAEGAPIIAEAFVDLLAEPLAVQIESGDWQECKALLGEVESWTDKLGRAIEAQTERVISDPALAARIVPPLWPVAGMLNVVEIIVADKDRVLANVPSEFGEVGWSLGCAVEKWAWGALRWSISWEGQRNPFEIALSLAAMGLFALGKRSGRLVFFSFVQTDAHVE